MCLRFAIRPLFILALIGALLSTADRTRAGHPRTQDTPTGLTSDAGYIVQRLVEYSQQYWTRVAGRDVDLPFHVNGHDEFAATWTREMLANLHGLPVGVFRQPFATPGFARLPATRPGVNIVVLIPGSQRPDHAIVIGSHYDGEPTSKGSAYDDTSGCMIILGLARALGETWRTQGLPSRTIEFVLFDGEEQGLVGSSAFGFSWTNGALMPRPDLMIDEEQSGVGYPVRPFGLASRNPTPSYALTTPPSLPRAARFLGVQQVKSPSRRALQTLLRRLRSARTSVFADLRAAYPTLTYRGGTKPVFTSADESYLQIGPLQHPGLSDNTPFDVLGVPTVTFSGDSDFYLRTNDWSFPFDQPLDTPELLACDTGGSPQPSAALEAALALPLGLSLSLVQGYAPPAPGSRLVVLSSPLGVNAPAQFQAIGRSGVVWNFGDGARGAGSTVTHTYARAGSFHLVARAGSRSDSWRVVVSTRQPVFRSHGVGSPPPLIPWNPPALQDIPGCH